MLEPMNHRDPNRPREPELPVVEDWADPGEPPDPPGVVGVGYRSEQGCDRPEGWEPALGQPLPLAPRVERAAVRR